MYTQKLIKKLWQAKCVFLSALSETQEKKTWAKWIKQDDLTFSAVNFVVIWRLCLSVFCLTAGEFDVMSEDTGEVGFWRKESIIIQHNVEYCQNEGQMTQRQV